MLDARRCISYLTIELKASIPHELRPLMGNWIYGCDVCQEVCPFVKRFARQSTEAAFRTFDPDRAAPPLQDLLSMTPSEFVLRFEGSPIKRIKYERLLRNACVAAGNSGAREFVPLLDAIAKRQANIPLAAEHATWAITRI